MNNALDHFIANLWNCFLRLFQPKLKGGLLLGNFVVEGRETSQPYFIPHLKRAEHIAVLGKTGTGKSSLLRQICLQDIRARRGFAFFDLHGDTTPYLLSAIAEQEQKFGVDLSDSLILIEPADPEFSVGFNVLSCGSEEQQRFTQIAEMTDLIAKRFELGPQSAELWRNCSYVLSATGHTLVEAPHLLLDASFRAAGLKHISNGEVRDYFHLRYDTASSGMQATMRNPVLNKITEFIADPHFRHIIGQRSSTFSLDDCLSQGKWIILKLDKGRLGPQATLLAGLFLSQLKAAIFRRRSRQLFSLFLDEVQNLTGPITGIDVLLSESRKQAIGVISANQYLSQYPQNIRAALLSVGTHLHFQLSGDDAQDIARFLDSGKSLAESLRNLPPRHFIAKSGHHAPYEVLTPELPHVSADFSDLIHRSQIRYARRRSEIEAEIQNRKPKAVVAQEALGDWE